MKWTKEQENLLRENYPKYGKMYCVHLLGMTEPQIRSKASRLRLVAAGISEAWIQKQKRHSEILTGRKRPDQAIVMKKLHERKAFVFTEERKKAISERTKKHIKEKGHAKGMLGKKHTEETKKHLSKTSSEAAKRMTEDQVLTKTKKAAETRAKKGTTINERKNCTWKGGWRNIGGIDKYYRSRWEANYARFLDFLKRNNSIKDWKHEPKTFWFEGIKRGCVSYLPDFCVTNNDGTEEYHEVKGWMDDRSKTKIARMRKYHPDVKLVVVCSKEYMKIKEKISFAIKDWE